MRTYWIIKGWDGEPHIINITYGRPLTKRSFIDPYWTYKEAMEVLHRWTKM